MSGWLVLAVTAVYAYVAYEQYHHQNWPMVVVYSGYAFSNLGLFMTVR